MKFLENIKVEHLKKATIILLIVILALISFVGIYKTELNKMVNIIPEYLLSMDFTESRVVRLSVNTSTKTTRYDADGNIVEIDEEDQEIKEGEYDVETLINEEEVLTTENYKKSKEIIIERLKKLKVEEYNLRQDENGYFVIELIENGFTDTAVQIISSAGKFAIEDSATGEVLLSNAEIKDARAIYGTAQTGTSVYLQIVFDKIGKQKLEEISEAYVEYQDEEGNTETKNVSLVIDGEVLADTYFGSTMADGILQIPIGQESASADAVNAYIEQASYIASILSSGNLPISYEVEYNTTFNSYITKEIFAIGITTAIVVLAAMVAYLIGEYKERGILAGLTFIGFIAIMLLIVRLTNCIISINGLVAITLIIIFDYLFTLSALRKTMLEIEIKLNYKEVFTKYLYIGVPICIIGIVFTFATWSPISSFGTILFWGSILFAIYNISITKMLLGVSKTRSSKGAK